MSLVEHESTLWRGYNNGLDYSHDDNTINNVPLSSCDKGNQAFVRLQKLHYGVVSSIILLAIVETQSIFHWLSCGPLLWLASESQLCVW